MKETKFIEQNKDKWQEYDKVLAAKRKDPDKLRNIFIEITDDLSYSRTFYPNRSVRLFLNKMGQRIFNNLYQNRSATLKRFKQFWISDLPQIVYHTRREFLLSLSVFILFMIIGIVSAANDKTFVSLILGERYVAMTEANIAAGDPMAVYKDAQEIDMFLGITVNNLLVAFRTFIMGFLLGIGTIAALLYNGIMVGAFQYFFYERGLFTESFLTIWQHGSLEISSIVIAGAAGITLGKGFVFPGTYSRLQSFQISARNGMKIMIGTVPIFVFAAFIESFVTRYTETPNIIRLLVIVISFGFIFGYFAVYPYLLWRNGKIKPPQTYKLPIDSNEKIETSVIKTNGDIFKDTFLIYRRNLRHFATIALVGAIVFVLSVYFFNNKLFQNLSFVSWVFGNLGQFIDYNQYQNQFIINTIIFSVISLFSLLLFFNQIHTVDDQLKENKRSFIATNAARSLVMTLIFNMIFFFEGFWGTLLFFITFPYAMMLWYQLVSSRNTVPDGLNISWNYYKIFFWKVIYMFFMIGLVAFIIYFVVGSPIVWTYIELIKINVVMELGTLSMFYHFSLIFITVFSVFLIFPLFVISSGILYYSLREILTAEALILKIDKIGTFSKSVFKTRKS